MSHAFIEIINIAKLRNRTTTKRYFLLQAIDNWPQRDKCIQGPYSHADTIQHPPIIAEREDNEENYHLTNISYKWDLNLRSDPDNGSDIFHGGSLQTNDRKDWQWLLCTGLNGILKLILQNCIISRSPGYSSYHVNIEIFCQLYFTKSQADWIDN